MIRIFILGQQVPKYLIQSKPFTKVIFGSWLTLVYKWKSELFIVSLIPCKSVICVPNKEGHGNLNLECNNTVMCQPWYALYFYVRRLINQAK